MSDPLDATVDVLHALGKLLTRVTSDEVKRVLSGDAKLTIVPLRWQPPAAPRSTRAVVTTVDAGEIGRELDRMTSRQDAVRYIESQTLRVDQLRSLARALGLLAPSRLRKPELVELIVTEKVGNRLAANAIQGADF